MASTGKSGSPSAGEAVRIVLNGEVTVLAGVKPTTTLLDWLRGPARLCGTKEGCAEGDCGACTVLIERRGPDGGVRRSPVTACLIMVGQVDELGIRTVEGLVSREGAPHPVQTAFADEHATQCGFCTPGFVMTGYAFAASSSAAEIDLVHDALSGNLCRCTGYKPIVRAVQKVTPLHDDPLRRDESRLVAALADIARSGSVTFDVAGHRFSVPRSLGELLALRAERPSAVLLAGGTDLGLMASRERRPPQDILYVGHVPELTAIGETAEHLVIGAAVTYSAAMPAILETFPTAREYLTRIGSWQIRNLGTLGGNLGTASPIGDMLPLFLAVGAELRLNSAVGGRRVIAADDFFLAYRKTALRGDEIIEAIALPKLRADDIFFADKVSKRRDQDISSVCAVYRLRIADGAVRDVRLAFGGMAAVPKRAARAEACLRGRPWSAATVAAAGAALAEDLAPIDDWRASAEYRLAVAANLLQRLYWRLQNPSALTGVP